MKDDAVYLRHVRECIRRIEEDTEGGQEQFMASHTIQDAVSRNLQTMAEATQRLSDAATATRPEVEWRAIAALRNLLVHDYLGVDLQEVWDITRRDIPSFKAVIAAMLVEQT